MSLTAILSHSVRFIGLSNEGKVLFNDALITFYVRLYYVDHVVKGHNEKGNPPINRHDDT